MRILFDNQVKPHELTTQKIFVTTENLGNLHILPGNETSILS